MYIIYKLYSKSDLTQTPVYIGYTGTSLNLRLKRHINKAKSQYGKLNWPVINWINKVIINKDQVLIAPIDHAETIEEVKRKEIYYIAKYKSEGLNLKNSTNGGDGQLGSKIKQFAKDGTFIKLWDCVANIEQELGLSNSHISSCCRGRRGRKTVGGSVWRYEIDGFDTYNIKYSNSYTKSIQKKIYQIATDGEIIKIWDHAQLIENELGFYRRGIIKICKDPVSKHKQRPKYPRISFGYHWAYESNKDIVQSLLKSKNTIQVDI